MVPYNMTDTKAERQAARSLRKYQGYWNMVKQYHAIQIPLAYDSDELRKRYIKAIKKEKLLDSKYRYSGELRFSWVGATLLVRLI